MQPPEVPTSRDTLQVRMLAAMGIRRWYLRSATSATDESATIVVPEPAGAAMERAPAVAPPPARPVEAEATGHAPISLAWAAGATGLVVFDLDDAPSQQFMRDLMSAMDGLLAPADGERSKSRVVHGELRWPQTDNASASPRRAIAAFFSKHLETRRWCGVTAPARAQLARWMPEMEASLVELEPLALCMMDSAAKRELWLRLQSIE